VGRWVANVLRRRIISPSLLEGIRAHGVGGEGRPGAGRSEAGCGGQRRGATLGALFPTGVFDGSPVQGG
jgi:hypothetical protein